MFQIPPFTPKAAYPAANKAQTSHPESQMTSLTANNLSSDVFFSGSKNKINNDNQKHRKALEKLRQQRVSAQNHRNKQKAFRAKLEATAKQLNIDLKALKPVNFQKNHFTAIQDVHERRKLRNRTSASISRKNYKTYLKNLETAIKSKETEKPPMLLMDRQNSDSFSSTMHKQDSGSLEAALQVLLWEPDTRTMDELFAEYDATEREYLNL